MKNSPLLVAFAVLIPGFVSCQCCGSDDPAPGEANTATGQDEDAAALALRDMQILKACLVHYQTNNGGSCPDKLDRLIEKDSNGKAYLEMVSLPQGPYGHGYTYTTSDSETNWELSYMGQDGIQGGEGRDADITLTSGNR